MSISVDVRLEQSFLVGGDHEHTPYACVRGNWSSARLSMRTPALAVGEWVHVGDVPTPPPGSLLHLNLYAHTEYSGIHELDEMDKGHTTRQIPCGTTSFEILEGERTGYVVDHYVATDTFRRVIQNMAAGSLEVLTNPVQLLGEERIAFAERAAMNYALKAVVSVRLRGGVPAPAPPRAAPSSAFFEKMDAAYVRRVTDLPLPAGANPRERFPANPTEPLVEQLHIVQWDTPLGRVTPAAFARRAPVGKVDAKFVEMQLVSAMLRHGMRPAHFQATIAKQFKNPGTLLSSTLTCLEVLENFAAFPSNAIQYGSDRRYPNLDFLRAQNPEVQHMLAPLAYPAEGGEPTASATPASATKCPAIKGALPVRGTLRARLAAGTLNALLTAHYGKPERTAADLAGGRKKEAPPLTFEEKCLIVVESWDLAHTGETNTADCEDSGFGGIAPLEALKSLRVKSRTIHAAQRLLAILHVWGSGSSVTAAYLKEDDATPAHVPMPVVGSREDKDFSEGGHAYVGLESRARVAVKKLRGLPHQPVHRDDALRVEMKLRAEVAHAPRFARILPPLFLEGTAPGLRFALPAEETYAGSDRAELYTRRAATKIAFVRACRNKLTEAHELVTHFCKMPSQTYEVWARKNPEQRVNPFYRTVLWLLFPDAVTPQLQQCVTINTETRQRGVTVGDYLRDPIEGGKVALVSPYADIMSAREWARDVAPYEEYMLEQQPVSRWGLEKTPTTLTGRIVTEAQVLQLASVATAVPLSALAMATTPPETHNNALHLLETTDEGESHVVLPLYAPAWRFAAAGEEKTRRFFATLEKMKKDGLIAEYLWARDAPMDHLPEQVELLLLLPVCNKVDEKLFPRE